MTTNGARRTRLASAVLAVTLSAGCSATSSSLDTATTGSVTASSAPRVQPISTPVPESSEAAANTTQPEQDPAGCLHADLPTTVAYTTIAGVDSNLTSVDVYPPNSSACNAPVVMWVHTHRRRDALTSHAPVPRTTPLRSSLICSTAHDTDSEPVDEFVETGAARLLGACPQLDADLVHDQGRHRLRQLQPGLLLEH